MLSESVEAFKKEKGVLEQKLSKLEQDQRNFKKEKESLLNKNKDKIVDIQNLNKQNDRLTNEIKRLKEEKTLFDSKIVSLENDNDHYQNRIRELEAIEEDLENQLESALEENITLQTEFEIYKQTTGDQLIRKDEEIRDIKNDLSYKDKYIQRVERRTNQYLVQNLQKNFKEGGNLEIKRRFTIAPGNKGGGNNLIEFQKRFLRGTSLNLDEKDENENTDGKKIDKKNTNINNNTMKLNSLKARNSLFSPGFGSLALSRLVKQKEEVNKGISNNMSDKKESKFMGHNREKSNQSLLSNKSIISDKRLAEEKIDEKSENSEISDKDSEQREFKQLKVCHETKFDFNGINRINNINNGAPVQFRILGNEKAILDTLQKLLERVRKRKERLNEKRKNKDRNKKTKQN